MKHLSSLLIFAPLVLAQDPGLPNAYLSISYWQLPALDGVADHQSAQLPTEAEVVIIGLGISGTSIAWHLLKKANRTTPLRINMLEARQACSGANGGGGGHTRGRLAAEVRVVDSIDAFLGRGAVTAVQQMAVLKKEVPHIGNEWTIFEGEEARHLSDPRFSLDTNAAAAERFNPSPTLQPPPTTRSSQPTAAAKPSTSSTQPTPGPQPSSQGYKAPSAADA